MDAYTGFAEVYDLFMEEIPYETWRLYLANFLQEHGIRDGLVLDLGCGTGRLTRLLADSGYDMIGVDSSGEMLGIAQEYRMRDAACLKKNTHIKETVLRNENFVKERIADEKAVARRAEILYLMQDMREFELYGTVRAAVSVCDSMNYITDYKDFVQTLKLVNNYLDPGGFFIFDLNTIYKYQELLGEQTIAENREEGSFIWENYFDGVSMINEYDLTLFIRQKDGRYQKFEETHYQRAYRLVEIRQAIQEAGMELVGIYHAFTYEPPGEKSERVHVVARERGKTRV